MKRFVDLRGQDIGGRFAWWDTVVDKFESFNGQEAFDDWPDFIAAYKGDELERYKSLCPSWVYRDLADERTVRDKITKAIMEIWDESGFDGEQAIYYYNPEIAHSTKAAFRELATNKEGS